MRSTPRFAFVVFLALPSFVTGCSSSSKEGADADGGGIAQEGGGCTSGTSSEGPSADAFTPGATSLVCYYASPQEGYCRKITDPSKIALYDGTNKGAIGCASAIVVSNAECPTKNSVGRCNDNSIEAQRVYYACSKFPDPKTHCDQISGTFAAF